MALVIVGGLMTACLLFYQGFHILKNGEMRAFFEESGGPGDSRLRVKPGARLPLALLYLVPSAAVMSVLTLALVRSDKRQLLEWLSEQWSGLFGAVFFLAYGLVAILRPRMVIRWIQSPYEGEDPRVQSLAVRNIIRGLGAFMFASGLLLLGTL